MNLLTKLEAIITPAVEENGIELYDLDFIKESGSHILRVFIDKEGGVDLNDCERVSHAVSDVLDEHDPIPSSYRLQVGSPGIERRLVKPEHFKRQIGQRVAIKLFAPHSPENDNEPESVTTGRKKFSGILTAYEDDKIVLTDIDGQVWTFDKKQVSACKLEQVKEPV
ncbi:MAG: ribosome maturation factor RimP [Defluviitaleaceae bacterium]|nr:ribosome maturation factor RimP [Defluviitaleaceae bacterium]